MLGSKKTIYLVNVNGDEQRGMRAKIILTQSGKDGLELQRRLLIKIAHDACNVGKYIGKIVGSKKYDVIYVMIRYKEFLKLNIEELNQVFNNMFSCGYRYVSNYIPKENLNEGDFINFYEIQRISNGRYYG
jgi:hypothetical protein